MFIETPNGNLKYRFPTVLENLKILKAVREHYINNDDIGAKIAVIEFLEPMLDYSEMNGIKNFTELNNAGFEMTKPLSEIADVILGKVGEAFAKKA